jgi:excisionase family DNA binding protein
MSDASQHQDDRESPRFYNVHEAARILRMSPMTLYRAIDQNSFPAVRVRNRLSVPAKAIDEMEAAALGTRSVVDAADWMKTTGR